VCRADFSLIKGVPRPAEFQDDEGNQQTLERVEIIARSSEQDMDKPDQIDPEDTIGKMGREKEIRIPLCRQMPGICGHLQ
jgi:hypothetical protein